ncbi:hypothetical protein LX36DRAFT_289327 [Colletotrichum falcatum]|nr:hypothetical protein LX36DRAFT_289327 [Colletotrichum falcatum]
MCRHASLVTSDEERQPARNGTWYDTCPEEMHRRGRGKRRRRRRRRHKLPVPASGRQRCRSACAPFRFRGSDGIQPCFRVSRQCGTRSSRWRRAGRYERPLERLSEKRGEGGMTLVSRIPTLGGRDLRRLLRAGWPGQQPPRRWSWTRHSPPGDLRRRSRRVVVGVP